MTYETLITEFLYGELPYAFPGCSNQLQFEAAFKAIIGTKQLRSGPVPSPETQVKIREIIRSPGDGDSKCVRFFTPMGCSKQADGAPTDILEVFMLKQLRGVSDALASYGYSSEFYFRLEDITDQYLFADPATGYTSQERRKQIDRYAESFYCLAQIILPNHHIDLESYRTSYVAFENMADDFYPVFLAYLKGLVPVNTLKNIGWSGSIPQEQRDYYIKTYDRLFPGKNPLPIIARYFAATLARVKLGATGKPDKPHITASFTHPIPGVPDSYDRVYYRTLPQCYTNIHRTPWLAKGYIEIGDATNKMKPKSVNYDDQLCGSFIPNTIKIGNVEVQADYLVN